MAALISVSAPFGSCQKEQKEFTRLELVAEGFQNNDNGTKLIVDGGSSTWVNGETVRINDNGELTISYTSGSSASVSGDFTTPIRAIYPASICTGDLTSGTTTVTLPAEYQYATDGVHQILESPMAAYSASGNEVHFKHLTGALTVSVYNNISSYIYVDAITVTSSKYRLGGSWTVDFDNLTGTGTPVATATLSLDCPAYGCEFNVGSLLGLNIGTAATMGGTQTTCTGNTTTGHITTVFTDKTGTKNIGGTTNRYVCGVSSVGPTNNQDVSTLNLTIE